MNGEVATHSMVAYVKVVCACVRACVRPCVRALVPPACYVKTMFLIINCV